MAKLAVAVDAKDHVQGPADAPVTLVEYADFQCPSCGDAYLIVKQLQAHFGARLRFVFRNFPLPMHPFAEPAAEAAEFAASQDSSQDSSQAKFWQMHDALYENQEALSEELLPELAEDLGLSAKDLLTAVKKKSFRGRIQADMQSGEKSGLRGTPTFYINGAQHTGSYDFATLKHAITAALGR